MKFKVGLNNVINGKLVILVTIFLVLSVFNTFGITNEKDMETEDIIHEYIGTENEILPNIRGARGIDPTWSPLFGSLPNTDDYYTIDFGDVNNDGTLDVVAGAGQSPSVGGIHCWIGDGLGGWSEQSNGLSSSGWYADLQLADLNNDGNLDIACGGDIYTGDGGAGGLMDWTSQFSPILWNGVALGDIDNNGTIDLVVGTNSGVRAWTSNGGEGGSFIWTDSSLGLPISGQYFGVYLGDVNNDGRLDIAAGSNSFEGVRVWTGNGESGLSALWIDAFSGSGLPTTGNYAQVCLGDANNDGKLDLAAASTSGSNEGVKFWKGNAGEGGFSWIEEGSGLATSGGYYGLSFGDVNNDGKLDLVGGNYSGGGIGVWLGDGGGGGALNWSPGREGLPGSTWIIDLCLGDVNNDGRLDIGATTNTQGVQVWAGNLPDLSIDGWISASTNLPVSSGWYDVRFGDVNSDGKLDIAAASNANSGVKVWLGDGSGVWTEVTDLDLPSTGAFTGVRLVDINHDGDLDLIAGKDDNNGMYVWLGNGSGGFGPNTGPGGTTEMAGLEVGDVNNDGNSDIASCYYIPGPNPVYVWLGDGLGNWPIETGPSEVLGYDDVALGDVDHNGNLDIFATTHMNGFRFWLGDGNGNWAIQPQNGLPSPSSAPWLGGLGVSLNDVDHDGNLDAAIGSWNGDFGLRVYISDGGAGGLVDWSNESVGLPITGKYAGVELGDINHDGNLDILSASCQGTNSGISFSYGNGGEGGSMVWTDALLADLPSSGDYWGVDLGDVNNDGVLDIVVASDSVGIAVYITQLQPSRQIDLSEGWNLISLPLIQSNNTISSVFSSIDGDYNAVQYYDSSDLIDPWKDKEVTKPDELNDLSEVNLTMGIWIHITKAGGTTLTVFGNEIGISQSITIKPGWNLVGFPSMLNKTRDIALNNLFYLTDVDSIWTYDSEIKQWNEVGSSDYFEVGVGYWVHSPLTNDNVWQVPL